VQTGAIGPSSAALARRIVEWIDFESARVVIELGPGTGAVTSHILERLKPGTKFFAVERNPAMVEALRARFPDITVHEASVAALPALCAQEGIEVADAMICGLPWAAFGEALQAELLSALLGCMRPHGQFVTFAYLQGLMLPSGRRFAQTLQGKFTEVGRSQTVWRNMPPALVYQCRR
jgi:phospholipid N-methyltransferase